MKSLYLIATLIIMATGTAQETETALYLIRHAEKADASADTHLSEEGKERAVRWSEYLSDKRIVAIYTTPYNRTRETVKPLADKLGIKVIEYDPRQMDLAAIIKKHEGYAVVIVGHSNTIPGYVNRLLGKNEYPDLQENEFGTLFVVNAENRVSITVTVEKL